MARYLTRLLGASRYILGASRYGSTVREENLGRSMSTLDSVSVPTSSSSGLWSLDYLEKPEASQKKPYKGSVYFTVDDLQMPNLPLDDDLFMEVLPVMYDTFYYKSWSLLQRYCCSKDTIFDIKVALENELVAMFVWFLFTDVPPRVKEGVAWALKDICSKTCEATNMDINDEGSAVHAPTKMSIDQESVDALLVDVLCSKNEEVLRQVCCSLGFVACCRNYRTVSFGNGIKKKLFQLSRECDSPAVLAHILFAISKIGMINEDMREKIIAAELSDGLLRRILSRVDDPNETLDEEAFMQRILSREDDHSETLKEEAYYMVYTILEGQCNDEIWKYLKEYVMPAVVRGCFPYRIDVMRIGACVIAKFIAKASPQCIKELVDVGCLKVLYFLLTSSDDVIKEFSLKAVENILSVGDADPSKNEYAKMIDDLNKEWKVFFVDYPDSYPELADLASGIVEKYRPDMYPEWLEWQDYFAGGWS